MRIHPEASKRFGLVWRVNVQVKGLSQNEGYFKVIYFIPTTLLSTGEIMQSMLKDQELSCSGRDGRINIIIIQFCKCKHTNMQKNLQRVRLEFISWVMHSIYICFPLYYLINEKNDAFK